MKKKNIPILLFVSILTLGGCKKETLTGYKTTKQNESLNATNQKTKLYYEFTTLLSRAVLDPDIRNFIKQESLLEVDNDNDVIYNFVKNKTLSNGQSFKENLKKYETYPNQIDIIENEIPLLTIFVPTIEISKFNPETWDSANDIPLVATNYMKEDKTIPIFDNGEELTSLASNEVPGFPILVVKSNERIKIKEDTKLKNKAVDKSSFAFISSAFDRQRNKKSPQATTIRINSTRIDPKPAGSARTRNGILVDSSIIRAYNLFGVDNVKWQRDHIYYNLTNENPNGRINLNMSETIASFTLSQAAIAKISDQNGDPILTSLAYQGIDIPSGQDRNQLSDLIQKNAWTDGQFEFRFDILINNKRGVGSVSQIYYPISPTDLFQLEYSYTLRPISSTKDKLVVIYELESTRDVNKMSNEIVVDLPIINWDIESNSPIWKISLYETDSQEVYTTKETVSNEFARNFGLDVGFEFFVKLGFNFGSSSKEVFSREMTVSRTVGEDDLGHVYVDFGHPVMTGKGGARGADIMLYEYKSTYFNLKMVPKRIY